MNPIHYTVFRNQGDAMTTPAIVFPKTRCAYCREWATVWLIDFEGKRNPGGWLCQSHGEAIVAEFATKLGETWTLAPLVEP